MAKDGEHLGKILDENLITIKMIDVNNIKLHSNDLELDTGSPHYIKFVEEVEKIDIKNRGII